MAANTSNYLSVDAATGADVCRYPPILYERHTVSNRHCDRHKEPKQGRVLTYTGEANLYSSSRLLVQVFYTPFINKHGMVDCEFYTIGFSNKPDRVPSIIRLREDWYGRVRVATVKDRAYEEAFHEMRYQHRRQVEWLVAERRRPH